MDVVEALETAESLENSDVYTGSI